MGANDPRGVVDMIYKEDLNTSLLTKYEIFGSCGVGEEDFFMFFPGRFLYGPKGHDWQDV